MNRPEPRRQLAAGFTLIELMVVVVIIGVVIAAMLLSVGGSGSDTQLEQERDRLAALIDYVRERAALQTVEYGMRCEIGDYGIGRSALLTGTAAGVLTVGPVVDKPP